jgi:hypothetical protein
VKKERIAIMEKARAKKKRQCETKLVRTATRKSTRRAGAPKRGLAQRVGGIVQEAVSEVGTLVKAAAASINASPR